MRGSVLGIVTGIMLGGSVSAYAASCADPSEHAAFHVRALQTDLMVAALTCNARDDYNQFALRFQNELVGHGKALKKVFHAKHGASAGEKALNKYVTALANRTSQRSIAGRSAYCQSAERTFAALAVMPTHEITTFSMQRSAIDVDVPSSCRPNVRLVDRTQ